ncbi:MAG TPA: type II toxin-antitoxin system VapC family toxin [Burkholderiaceae bacterium]|nr:type II toxin-antitoxin system VapC family toxin [Burkholderiaceae bacterium]
MTRDRPPRPSAPAGCVIDASVPMPWCFADEASVFTEALLDTLADQRLWAPALWVLECANGLQSAQRRRRIDAPRRAEIALERSSCQCASIQLSVRIDPEPPDFISIDRLAAGHELSAYDAAYLELALRRALPLVSLDAKLLAAAQRLGHPVVTAPKASPASGRPS